MARRLLILIVALSLIPSGRASADEYIACWVVQEVIPGIGVERSITRCRLAGGEIVEFASDNQVPDRLYPAMGSVGGVACWYYTSRANTLWVIVYVYPNGDADIAVRSADSTPVAIGLYSRCDAEPDEIDVIGAVWEYALSYTHPPPTPDLSPEPGFGVTGMETYLGVTVPERHTAVLSAGGLALQLEIEVDSVIVHWGDGAITTHPADGPQLVAGPDGPAFHIYEQKMPSAQVAVAYSWEVHWRPVGAAWNTLAVPDTMTTLEYPVWEIVSVIGG